jgi:hypothetical protein
MAEGQGDTVAIKTLDLYRPKLQEEELAEASKRAEELENLVNK